VSLSPPLASQCTGVHSRSTRHGPPAARDRARLFTAGLQGFPRNPRSQRCGLDTSGSREGARFRAHRQEPAL